MNIFEMELDSIFLKKGITYLLISVIATTVDFGLLVVLVDIVQIHYLIASTISFSLGVSTKFWLNRFTVFRDRLQKWYYQLTKFVSVSTTGLLITNVIMFVGVDVMQINYQITKLVCIGLVFFITLIFHNYFSFSTKY